MRKSPNIAIVGSTSALGKELREMLEERSLPIGRLALLETEEYAGLLQEFAGDIQITQVISPSTLEDIDVAFFTCSPEIMRAYVASGARFPDLTIDLTQTGRNGVVYLHGVSDKKTLRSQGYFVNPHPATIVIGRVLSDLHHTYTVQSAHVTVLEPASERGNAGVEELQEQTVSLLNFQQVEKKVFRGQLAFNILPEDEASAATEKRILDQLHSVFGETFPSPGISVLQTPVFHSISFSMFVHLLGDAHVLLDHLKANPNLVVEAGSTSPSPVAAVGSDKIHIGRVRPMEADAAQFALWVVADNLRIAASNAIQTAEHILLASAIET